MIGTEQSPLLGERFLERRAAPAVVPPRVAGSRPNTCCSFARTTGWLSSCVATRGLGPAEELADQYPVAVRAHVGVGALEEIDEQADDLLGLVALDSRDVALCGRTHAPDCSPRRRNREAATATAAAATTATRLPRTNLRTR